MFQTRPLLIPIFLLATAANVHAQSASDPLATLRPNHPRLMLLDDDLARLKSLIHSDPTAKAWFTQLKTAADAILTQPVAQRVLVGPRLLGVSRQVFSRVSLLAGMYRLTNDSRYAARARDEMLAVAAFEDWHPPHFLDTAEMTNAMAIGYDWLYSALSPEERAAIRTAIIQKGLNPGLAVYTSGKGFSKVTNNWNQVCNGGMIVGALAIADDDPNLARQILAGALKSLPLAMKEFAPDGGIPEGPGYWAYATEYTAYFLSALHTALGTDFDLANSPGLADSGLFRIQSIGPIGKTFNFADAHDSVSPAPQMFLFARLFNRPIYAAHERSRLNVRGTGVLPFHLFWYAPADSDLTSLPTAALFKRINVTFFRTSWTDRNAAFVGFKGGNNAASHAHLDLGSFVYDADGLRWAFDLGPDDYNLPAYFGRQRRDYYRLRTEGHNTITLDDTNQLPTATAPIIAFSAEKMRAVADLSKAYPTATQVRRGLQLLGKSLLIQDELHLTPPATPATLTWHLHTPAHIQINQNGKTATLTQSGKTLTARILQPENATFAIAPSDIPPTTQSTVPRPTDTTRQPGQKLILRLPDKITDTQVTVLLIPQNDSRPDPRIEPLDAWIADAQKP